MYSLKQTIIATATIVAAAMWQSVARADEGMWTLYNLPPQVYAQMQQEGFALPSTSLYADTNAIKNSVVNFSGHCSGVVVSPDGLVFTNHHCGFEAIRSHSTVEHDYMIDGFIANSYEEELPNENMFVSFMVSQEDITDRMLRAAEAKGTPVTNWDALIDSVQQVMTDSARLKDKTLHVEIDAFYEGNAFYATTYRKFDDLRLVFALPRSMGKFGGDTDNWMWPRQTCDFSVFRIYADPNTNGPAKYSKDNVPYRPSSWTPVSLDGYQKGSFAMTMGYPGTTNRYLSSYGIRLLRDARNTPTVQARDIRLAIMRRHMSASEAVRIKYDTKYAINSNYWKNFRGMNNCIDSIGLIAQKRAYERRIQAYQDSTGYMKGQLDFGRLDSLYQECAEVRRANTYFNETFRGTSELVTRAMKANNGGVELQGPRQKPRKQYIVFADNSNEWDEALDKEVLATLLKNYRQQVPQRYHPDFFKLIDRKFRGNYAAYVDWLYDKSVLMKSGKRIYPNKKKYLKDPGIQMGLDLAALNPGIIKADLAAYADSIQQQEKALCAVKLRMEQDLPHYSDANFTMRLSYGQVGGYLSNGRITDYYTEAESIVEKMKQGDHISDYKVEPIMQTLLSATDFGPYSDAKTGKMQLCFLTNNDITGGNSGSPMFDGQGRLIGLAFDGNWESLSNPIFFDTTLSRCIGVDIRYVLYMIDRWGHADRLLRELGVKH